ncbi:MAG: hypothetical protein A07HB70_01303 [uncultured archaeon A07HB70]|nr:MAG: hypothetical protein A07HB70_01303 [uncultured archaeon A07HB70]
MFVRLLAGVRVEHERAGDEERGDEERDGAGESVVVERHGEGRPVGRCGGHRVRRHGSRRYVSCQSLWMRGASIYVTFPIPSASS